MKSTNRVDEGRSEQAPPVSNAGDENVEASAVRRSRDIRLNWASRILLSTVLLGVGFLIGLFLNEPTAPIPSAVDPSAETVSVISEFSDGELETSVQLVWGDAGAIRSPGWSGTITRLAIGPDGILSEGDLPVAIDGIDRMAIATEEPPFRVLLSGSRGRDVVELRRVLERLGYLENESGGQTPDVFGSDMAEASRALSNDLGFQKPSSTIDPAWFIWIPSLSVEVSSSVVAVGSPAPSQGEPVFLLKMELESATLSTPPPSEGYILTLPGIELGFAIDGSKISAAELDDFTNALLTVGHVRGTTDPVFAVTKRESPVEVLQVPASSLGVAADGSACVWIPEEPQPVRVEIDSSSLGLVSISPLGDLSPGAEVLLNPGPNLRASC